MRLRNWLVLLIVFLLSVGQLSAQETGETFLSLEIDSPALQTGQEYEVRIWVENVSALWLANLEISYDPALIYVLGTRAGSPVQAGTFWGTENTGSLLNMVEGDQITFAQSMFNPAEPVSGSGVIGVFRIYPLAAGSTEIRFATGTTLTRTIFDTSSGQRIATASEEIAFTPVLLQLTITGASVTPPPEETATPTPTFTPTPDEGTAQVELPTEEPTLVNITRADNTNPANACAACCHQ